MTITKGPNLAWYALTIFIVLISWNNSSIYPILGWILFWAALIPICIWLHNYNEKEREKLLKDFPYDPIIQAKYRRK